MKLSELIYQLTNADLSMRNVADPEVFMCGHDGKPKDRVYVNSNGEYIYLSYLEEGESAD